MNASIEQLKTRIDEVRNLIASRDPNDDSWLSKMSDNSMEVHLNDLSNQLRQWNESRAVEVLQMSLKGKGVSQGSIPLLTLSELGSKFANSILHASEQHVFGKSVAFKQRAALWDAVDLSLSGIARGSTKLIITGNSSPDLFGKSILQDTISASIELLETRSSKELVNRVSNVGANSVSNFIQFLDVLREHRIEIELSWDTPDFEVRTWKASRTRIASLATRLNSLKFQEETNERVRGKLETNSRRKPIEILSKGRIMYIIVPQSLVTQLEKLYLGADVIAEVSKMVISIPGTKHQKTKYTLKSIRKAR